MLETATTSQTQGLPDRSSTMLRPEASGPLQTSSRCCFCQSCNCCTMSRSRPRSHSQLDHGNSGRGRSPAGSATDLRPPALPQWGDACRGHHTLSCYCFVGQHQALASMMVPGSLDDMPNEVLLHIFGYLEVCDLLATSRTNHHLRHVSLAPILHSLRLRRIRSTLPPLLHSPSRPSLADLIGRRIFMTQTTVMSRKLARSLVSIRLSRRLAARPSPESLVARAVLPPECVPGAAGNVAPALVARKRAVEKERVKDGLRGFVGRWTGEARERGEGVRRFEESRGVGRVWRLKRFWERIGRGDLGGASRDGR